MALKETQDLKVRLQQIQLSTSNSQVCQKGQNATLFTCNGSHKTLPGGQLNQKKEAGYKASEKAEQCSSVQKQNYISAQRTDHLVAPTHGHKKDENKENEPKDGGKPKSARYLNYFSLVL